MGLVCWDLQQLRHCLVQLCETPFWCTDYSQQFVCPVGRINKEYPFELNTISLVCYHQHIHYQRHVINQSFWGWPIIYRRTNFCIKSVVLGTGNSELVCITILRITKCDFVITDNFVTRRTILLRAPCTLNFGYWEVKWLRDRERQIKFTLKCPGITLPINSTLFC